MASGDSNELGVRLHPRGCGGPDRSRERAAPDAVTRTGLVGSGRLISAGMVRVLPRRTTEPRHLCRTGVQRLHRDAAQAGSAGKQEQGEQTNAANPGDHGRKLAPRRRSGER